MDTIYAYSAPPGFRGIFRQDENARSVYSEAAGIAQVIPRGIAVPVDADDVRLLVQWAHENTVPLIPRGSGSSMAGGAIGDGVIVDLSTISFIGEVDAADRTIRCGPGALRNAIDEKARSAGLTFPVDPSSGAFCTIGGMTSTNAAGAHTLKYGAMRKWVQSVDCIFADGSRATIRRSQPWPSVPGAEKAKTIVERARPSDSHVRKQSSGYAIAAAKESGDLVDLIVGSEGTLAIVVEIELRLTPVLNYTASVLGAFADIDAAVTGAGIARDAGVSACELIDKTFLDVARQGGVSVPAPVDAQSVLLVEIEGSSAKECENRVQDLADSFRKIGATAVSLALNEQTQHEMWELRHAASPVLSRLDPSLKSMQFIEDGCVPPDSLGAYVLGVRAALAKENIRGVIFGHAGDAHVHVNPLIDVREPDWRERANGLLESVVALTAKLGGTLSGEHGDGRLRTPLLGATWSAEDLAEFHELKTAFDPAGILNPGVKVPLAGQHAIENVKYDPHLAPLPSPARAALDRVERERAYAKFRLDLLENIGHGEDVIPT